MRLSWLGGKQRGQRSPGGHRLKPTNTAPSPSKAERRTASFQAALATLVNATESGKFWLGPPTCPLPT